MEFQEIERPDRVGPGGYPVEGTVAALRETAKTGKALRFPTRKARNVSGSYATRLRTQGYRLHVQTTGPDTIAWCEKIADKSTTP